MRVRFVLVYRFNNINKTKTVDSVLESVDAEQLNLHIEVVLD